MGMYLLTTGTKIMAYNTNGKVVEHIIKKEHCIPKEAIIIDPIRLHNNQLKNDNNANFTTDEILLAKSGNSLIDTSFVDTMRNPNWNRVAVYFGDLIYI